MLNSARFVIEKTIAPAKALYENTKDLDESVMPLDEKEKIKKIYDQTVDSGIVLSRLKKTGDVYKYLQKSIATNDGETKKQMNKLRLLSFEDILDEFEMMYKNQLNDITVVDELVVDDLYTTWDFIFLADVYRTQTPGILGVHDLDNQLTAVIARGNFKEDEQTYHNEYLSDDGSKIKYYLIKGKHKYNQYITDKKLAVYFFETIASNQQLFKGVYELESFDSENNYVVLTRKKHVSTGTPPKDPVSKRRYREQFKPSNVDARSSGGHSKTGKYKQKAGERAEQIVSDYLHLKNIENKLLSTADQVHHYDIEVKEGVNLEVKNITNNVSFYLSESQIKEYQDDNTRLCFVDIQKDDNLIYISKPYEKTTELKQLIEDYLELKAYSVEKYNGRLRVDSIEIGIIKPEGDLTGDLYEDFREINSLSRKKTLEFLAKDSSDERKVCGKVSL